MGKVKYGIIKNHDQKKYTRPMPLKASATFEAKSGRFVIRNGAYIDAAGDGADEIVGAIEFVGTAGSSDGDTSVAVERSCDVLYEVPAYDGADYGVSLTKSDIDGHFGDLCDLSVDGDTQYADISGSPADDVLIIEGGNADRNTLYVRMNPNELGQTDVS